jgi:hypothetical protein
MRILAQFEAAANADVVIVLEVIQGIGLAWILGQAVILVG